MKISSPFLWIVISSAIVLSACGGGSGGGSASSTPSTSTGSTSSSTPQANVGTLSSPEYAGGSNELSAFQQLNQMRQECGFPALSDNSLLDKATQNHRNYMIANNSWSHYETQGNTDYTGTSPSDRGTAVGYPWVEYGETIGAGATGTAAIVGLSSIPYHAAGLFYDYAEVGMAYGTMPSGTDFVVADFGNQTVSPTAPAYSGAPLTYPCSGLTGVQRENVTAEDTPPYINGAPATNAPDSWGTPIVVEGNVSDTVRLTSVSVTGPKGAVAVSFYDSSDDPQHVLIQSEAFAIPNAPLAATTTYSVVASGTINGTPFTRSFSFTTGN